MIDGTYSIIMRTPLGAKKANIFLKTQGASLSGSIIVKGEPNTFTEGTTDGEHFQFKGDLLSSVGKFSYECIGSVSGNEISAIAKSKKGTIEINGTRKE